MTDTFVDGNEMAGALRELFAVDVTTARGRCAGCGREAMVAEVRVYDRAPGQVARCPSCETVMFRVVRGPDRAWLDLRGMTVLEFQMP
jgi:Zn finger protein HypA/HybF involved in hydrogenase expression